ncbi:MAG: hypothetical protein GX078_00575 [Clostridiales bacterium]|nr:hypothetical protein [Clostridiales bacterium]
MAFKKKTNINDKRLNKMINTIPGTLMYKGQKNEKFIIERFYFDDESLEHQFYENCNETFLEDIKKSKDEKVQWINVIGINNIEEINKLGKIFGIDKMILEQMLNISKHSFYKVTDEYIYNDIQMIQTKDGEFIYENISIYLYDNILLTFQERKGDVFDSIRERIKNNQGNIRNMGIEYTYFCLLDAIIDHYIYSLESMLLDIGKMEFDLMENKSLNQRELHRCRKQIILIRMSANPLDKLLLDLVNLKEDRFMKNKEYFESLSQHVQMTISEVNVQKETVDGLYDNYMITNSNDMNHVMTVLTIFSAIFIPLSFLTGVFGMNFKNFPALEDVNGFYYFVGGCVATAVLMIIYFKKKKWF